MNHRIVREDGPKEVRETRGRKQCDIGADYIAQRFSGTSKQASSL